MNFDNSANMTHNQNWHSKNECVDFQLTVGTSGFPGTDVGARFPDIECSEVELISPNQDVLVTTTWPSGDSAPTWYLLKANEYHTWRGITNVSELTAKGEAGSHPLYGRSSSYQGIVLAAG